MLNLLFILTIIFFVLNLFISKFDLFNPSVIFHLVFLIQIFMCVIARIYLDIVIHTETLFVLSISYVIFTFLNIIYFFKKKHIINKIKNIYINISNKIIFFIILILLLSIFLNYKYLLNVAELYGVGNFSLSEIVALNDSLIKFNRDTYDNLGLYIPIYTKVINLLAVSFSYFLAYVFINNYVFYKKVNYLYLLIFMLFLINVYLGGSRSPIFRIFTFCIFMYYILSIRSNIKSTREILKKIIKYSIFLFLLFILTIEIYGRVNNYNTFHYVFIYLGAPLWNLDTFISNSLNIDHSIIFGEQTFINFYRFIGVDVMQNLPFLRYNSTYGLGNVYTTFYQFIYDFGFLGVPILVLGFSLYYIITYYKLTNYSIKTLDIRLFIYAYLFNDLIMLIFSNRFYESVLNANNIRIFLVVYFIFIFQKKIKIK